MITPGALMAGIFAAKEAAVLLVPQVFSGIAAGEEEILPRLSGF